MRKLLAAIALIMIPGVLVAMRAMQQTPQGLRRPNVLTIEHLPFKWPDTQEEAAGITDAQVLDLFHQLDAVFPGVGLGETYPIEDYVFAKLDGTSMYLVALPDASGRNFYYEVGVVQCHELNCTLASVPSAPPHDLATEIRDIDKNGHHEIVTTELVGGYEGTRTNLVYIYRIYEMNVGALKDVSGRYRGFYEQTILPRMKASEADAVAWAGEGSRLNEARAEIVFAYRDYDRRILGIGDAGLSEARGWMSNPDEQIQDLAIRTFQVIDRPDADAALAQMAQSANKNVSDYAKAVMERRTQVRGKPGQ